MAELLKRQHHLVALKTSLVRKGRSWLVKIELETHEGAPRVAASWELSTAELGLPKYFEPFGAPTFRLPPELVRDIADQVGRLDLPPSHPVWLHLVKPYGYLGMVPWEDLLVPPLGRPVLRLPDFLEPPRERRDTLDVAICCSVPSSEPTFSVSDLLAHIATAVLGSSLRPRTQLHVFPDVASFDVLQRTFGAEQRVSLHDPRTAPRYEPSDAPNVSPTLGGTVTSPWLRWMRDEMKGRSLDTVHFACHGYFNEGQSSLTVAEAPVWERSREDATFLGIAEISAFLNQTGAWSLVCTAPPHNYSDAGLRYFVDSIAQVRPGPALFHDATRDQGFVALGDAYRFLFSPTPAEAVAGPIFMYCQPALVESQLPIQTTSSLGGIVDRNDELFREGTYRVTPAPFPGVTEVPTWIASAQRYVEEQVQDVQRRQAVAQRTQNDRSHKRSAVVTETLAEVQQIVGDFARSSIFPTKS